MAPATNEMANPWKIGSNNIIDAPITTAPVVNKIGVVPTGLFVKLIILLRCLLIMRSCTL